MANAFKKFAELVPTKAKITIGFIVISLTSIIGMVRLLDYNPIYTLMELIDVSPIYSYAIYSHKTYSTSIKGLTKYSVIINTRNHGEECLAITTDYRVAMDIRFVVQSTSGDTAIFDYTYKHPYKKEFYKKGTHYSPNIWIGIPAEVDEVKVTCFSLNKNNDVKLEIRRTNYCDN